MFCKKCGNKLVEEAKFCGKCGEKVSQTEVSYQATGQPKQKEVSGLKKFGVIILSILLVLGGLHFGIIPALIGAALASLIIKKSGIVKENSAWVSETKGVKIAKYVLLAVIVIPLLGLLIYQLM